MENKKSISFIGVAQGWGAKRSGTEDGPKYFFQAGLQQNSTKSGVDITWESILSAHSSARGVEKELADTLPHVLSMDEKLCTTVRKVMRHQKFPVVIGGDHSIAVGTWSGVISALNAQRGFGLIWVDAHMDSHTLETCHEGLWGGYYHGQPVSALLGYGEESLVNVGGFSPKISPEHVCLIGVRSFEAGEEAFLKKHGVRVFMMDEVKKRGLESVFREALDIVNFAPAGFGMSVDMDAFDPSDAPGVGSVENDGLSGEEFVKVASILKENEFFKALEITEYNPHRDREGETLTLLQSIILSCLPL